ncbi:MAG: TatD family hydrolase [Patescibacteria group bacterium]
MKLIDSHCHLNFSSFKDDYREIIADCLQKEIGIVNVGSQIDTSTRALNIANEYPNDPIYAVIGLHPIHLSATEVDKEEIKFKSREEVFNENKYQELIDVGMRHGAFNKKIIAIGEIGLDYWHIPIIKKLSNKEIKEELDWKEKQKQGFIGQLKFAEKNNLPVVFHARGSKDNPEDAYDDLFNIVSSVKCPVSSVRGVIHSFDSRVSLETAKKFLDLGFYIGFNGVITFKNKSVDNLREIVKYVPIDRILVETDAPYLTPEPHRGEKNIPQNVKFVASKIGELKEMDYEKILEQTTQNFINLFLNKI